jgi:hypothetical protein
MTSFADSWEYQELLNIAKEHLDSLDRSRVHSDAIIGVDNFSKMKVSAVFAAVAIEAALNDFVLIHCLFLEQPYLQGVLGDITENFLRASVHQKINLVRDHWPDEFPTDLLKDVRELFRIRNRITHQTHEFQTGNYATNGQAVMKNCPLTNDEMQHMLRHYDIARDFLSRFWLPGNREFSQPLRR